MWQFSAMVERLFVHVIVPAVVAQQVPASKFTSHFSLLESLEYSDLLAAKRTINISIAPKKTEAPAGGNDSALHFAFSIAF